MAKYKHTEGIQDLLDGLINLDKQFHSINQTAINTIAKRAVEIAKEKLENGVTDWEPHSDVTPELTMKLRGGTTKDLLNETGKLKDSIRITMNVVSAGNMRVEIGSDMVYAAIHEYGGTTGGAVGGDYQGYIPPRPYLRPAIEEAILEAVDNGLDKRIAEAYELSVLKKPWRHLF